MNYLLLILEPKGQRAERGQEAGRAVYDRMLRFGEDLKTRGVLLASESLLTEDQGVRVQVRDGRARTLDGPFSESKEMIGGYFLLECASLDAAVAIAKECPAAEWATLEVRPVGPCWA